MERNVRAEEDAELAELMKEISAELTAYQPGNYVMTDDKAPVELLGMQVIDDLIQKEVGFYRGIFEREGIAGLLEAM